MNILERFSNAYYDFWLDRQWLLIYPNERTYYAGTSSTYDPEFAIKGSESHMKRIQDDLYNADIPMVLVRYRDLR